MKKEDQTTTLSVKIADQRLTLRCPPAQVQDLQHCAQYVNQLMQSALKGKSHSASSIERVALMTALNIAYDLLVQQRQQENYAATLSHRIESLQNKIEQTLQQQV